MRKIRLCMLFMTLLLLPITTKAECNHRWSNWSVYEYADCDTDGKESRYCYECDKEETRTIVATGHQWGDWEIDDQPSCYSNGSRERRCLKCGEYQKEDIPAYNSHQWGEWVVDYPSTCGETGYRHRYCTRCGEYSSETTPINPDNHVLGDWMKIEPSVFSNGELYRDCYCGKIRESNSIPKLKSFAKLNKAKATLKVGKTLKLKCKKKAYGDYVEKWKTSNKKIATIDKNGKIKAKGKGNVTITLVMASGVKAKCKITVK